MNNWTIGLLDFVQILLDYCLDLLSIPIVALYYCNQNIPNYFYLQKFIKHEIKLLDYQYKLLNNNLKNIGLV